MFILPLNKKGVTLIDDEDMPLATCFNWYDSDEGYAVCNMYIGNGKQIKRSLHRFLLNFPRKDTDHIDGNRKNNQRNNLREVTNRQNAQNRQVHRDGKLPNVNYRKERGKYQVKVRINGIQKHIGYYDTELEGYIAYKKYMEML